MGTMGFSTRLGFIGIFFCLAVCGCSSKESGDAQEKAVEKIIETSLAKEGKIADIDINKDNKSVSITVKDEKDAQATTTMNVAEDGDQMDINISSPDGNMKMQSGPDAKIPEAFPKDVPLYPGIKLQMIIENENQGYSLMGTTADSMSTVVEFYKKSCAEQGWTETMVMSQGEEMATLNYKKGKRILVMLLSVTEGEVSMNITTALE